MRESILTKNNLIWVGPVIDLGLFESTAFFYDVIYLVGQPFYDISSLSQQCREKVRAECSVLVDDNDISLFECEALENVAYSENVKFLGNNICTTNFICFKRIDFNDYLQKLDLEKESVCDIMLANQLIPPEIWEKVIEQLPLLNSESFFYASDNRLNKCMSETGAVELLEKENFLLGKKLSVGKVNICKFYSCGRNTIQELESKIKELEKTNVEINESQAKHLKLLEESKLQASSLKDKNDGLQRLIDDKDSKLSLLKNNLEKLALENHHMLINLSKE